MEEKIFQTGCGDIHYYMHMINPREITLVFLPGLTADHTLFDKQIAYFEGKMNVMTWDAPGHAASRPFVLEFELADKARWLCKILEKEGIDRPLLIGQSMGGYVSQAFLELFPNKPVGFICIDSAPLPLQYSKIFDLFLMEHIEPVYRLYPWKTLLKAGSKGVAATPYGQQNMYDMMMTYHDDPKYYCRLVGHGYRMLARAIKADLPYRITCPALLICGEEDKAGTTRDYNRRWHEKSGVPIKWIPGAGHNSNADKPEEINAIIDDFIKSFS